LILYIDNNVIDNLILNFIQTASIIYQIDDDATVNELWNSFKLKFNRTYDSSADSQRFVFNAFIYFFFYIYFIIYTKYRIEIFKDNLKKINEHNAGESSYEMGITQFADWTHEEFAEFIKDHSFCFKHKDICSHVNSS